ncbi:sensor histidine kinase [Dethiobacter alkaliphilus]|uniref:sensor histidine kinase n=1 Tax=Dethiobacter alkaliphilus TaxID=427926 RepID=UPI002225D665|nr:sensor histidine kinase [Dethiobacter alkaliphilus]MCW3489624.1 sensor histidine kinase [Dethiobacter alkaliphilus]
MQEIKQLDEAIRNTISAVQQGREDIMSISGSARQQRDELLAKLVDLKGEILDVITAVDRLEREEKLARIHLMEVNRNFNKYTEKDIQQAYEEAQHIQLQLSQMREREAQHRQRRDQLEIMVRRVNETVERAKKLETQVGMALELISGGLQGVTVKLDEIQLRQQVSLRIIKAQEEERLRVAREIHDGPAQSMANVVLRAEICEKLMSVEPDKVRAELHDLKDMVKESLQEVRKIIFDLRPMVLDDLGIVPTLRRFIAELQKRTDMNIELVVLGGEEQRLASVLEVAIFRIVQESLNNIYKHAEAKRCVIKLEILPGRINISIADNGRGFDTEKTMQNMDVDCFGLLGMRERVELLDGQIKIVSMPEKGTEIHVSIPIKG